MTERELADPAQWLEEHGDYLFRYAMKRVRDRELAEDLVQETLLAALRGRERFSGRSSARTWLVGILKRKVIDQFRRHSRELPASELESDDVSLDSLFDRHGLWKRGPLDSPPGDWPDNPAKALEQEDFRRVLAECLNGVPPRLAAAFTLREMDELPSEEVCKILDVTATNLWTMLHRARGRLRRCLELIWFGQAGK